jgi:hypothetical protein
MTAAAQATRAKKPRTLHYNAAVGALYVTVGTEEFAYWLDRLSHCEGGVRAFRLTKFIATQTTGSPDHYDVTVRPADGSGTCECRGHLRWGHKTVCKHRAALLALHRSGKLS